MLLSHDGGKLLIQKQMNRFPWLPQQQPQGPWPTWSPLLVSRGFISVLLSKARYSSLEPHFFPPVTRSLSLVYHGFLFILFRN